MKLMLSCVLALFAAVQTVHARSTVRNQYIVFSDRGDFESYLQSAMPLNFSLLIEHKDARYTRAEEILRRVWEGYRKYSSTRTDQLPVPFLGILKSEDADGFVATDPVSRLFPNAFFLLEKTLEQNDDEIAGLIAHELTHLLTPDFNDRFYRVAFGEEPLGYLQDNDPQAEALVKQWHAITRIVGPVYIPELNGLPAPLVYDGEAFNLIGVMASKWGDSKSSSCQNLKDKFPTWRHDLALHYMSMIDQVVRMTDEQRKELDRQTRAYISDMRSCLGNQSGQLISILVESLHKSPEELSTTYGELAKTFDREANVVDGLFAVVAEQYLKLNEFSVSHDLSAYRVYSSEEIADDNSVRILPLAGYSATGLGSFLLSYMDKAQPGSRAECEAILSSGKVPPYGMITDPHHSACYRVYHLEQIARVGVVR